MTGPEPSRPKRPLWRRILRHVERLLALTGLFFIVYHLCFETMCVTTSSMRPALNGAENGPPDWVLCEKLTYSFRAPRRWEVALLRYADGAIVAKRVAGLPGEQIAIRDAKVCIDGNKLTPPPSLSYLYYVPAGYLGTGMSLKVREGRYFFLGDDSADSQDSRYEGDLPAASVQGRPLLRIWPPSRIGFVNP